MTQSGITDHVLDTYPGTVINQNWGETGIFYNHEQKLKKEFIFIWLDVLGLCLKS
jgi:hypothetical protein